MIAGFGMKINNMMIVAGATIACLLTFFLLNVVFLWVCAMTVQSFGIIVPAASVATITTVMFFFRIRGWRS